jgi:hypothetical protein
LSGLSTVPGPVPDSHERRTGRPWDDSYTPAAAQANALEIAARGIEIIGADVAHTAIRQAQETAAGRGIAATFLVADALQLGNGVSVRAGLRPLPHLQ